MAAIGTSFPLALIKGPSIYFTTQHQDIFEVCLRWSINELRVFWSVVEIKVSISCSPSPNSPRDLLDKCTSLSPRPPVSQARLAQVWSNQLRSRSNHSPKSSLKVRILSQKKLSLSSFFILLFCSSVFPLFFFCPKAYSIDLPLVSSACSRLSSYWFLGSSGLIHWFSHFFLFF